LSKRLIIQAAKSTLTLVLVLTAADGAVRVELSKNAQSSIELPVESFSIHTV
jgi:hypothetical protein